MIRACAAAALVLATPTMASATPAECAKISTDLDRLACYDKEVGRIPTALPATVVSKWTVQQDVSKLTDQRNVVLTLRSTEQIDCGWNRGGNITLVVRCMENKTALYFDTGCHMASSDYNRYGEIMYRIDDEKALTVDGNASTDNRALGLWSGGRAIPVIKQMLGKSRMVARMTPFSESPFTATFDIAGIDEAIKPLRAECRW